MWISFMILIIVVVLIMALSIDTKASKEEVGKLKEDIKLLTNNTKDLNKVSNTVHNLKNEIHQLYKYKVIYKDKFFMMPGSIDEKYFFDERSAKKFMENSHIYEEVLIELDEEKQNKE